MILCCGEALIDMVPTVGKGGEPLLAPLCGGAIYNTAIGLGRLGTSVGFLTGLSGDLFGRQLEQGLHDSHVDTSLVIRSSRPTTLAFVQLEGGHATYTFYDENTAGRGVTVADLPELPGTVSTLYFGGISLCSEPAADAYHTLCLRHAADHVVMIDPNIRPDFVEDRDRYMDRITEMVALSDIVKVSDEDLDWIIPGNMTLAEKTAEVLKLGPKMAILTRGAQGAKAVMADGRQVSVPVPKVKVCDTVGAGDTFNAGVLAKLAALDLLDKAKIAALSDDKLAQVLSHGAAVAAVTVSRKGANPPWAHEL